jgi:hypothetical protein
MNDLIVDRILARPDHGLDGDAVKILRRMATYFDRASLKIVWDDGAPGSALVLHLSDDAVRYRLSIAEMRALWEGMRQGHSVDWLNLPQIDRPS